MTERVALYLQDAHDLRDGLDYVRYAEARGFEAVWQAESRLVRDAIVPMAAYAAVTERIKVGSGVINNWTRNIGLLAATFLTLDDLAPRPHHLRHRRLVGPAGAQRGHRAPQAADRHARDGRSPAPPAEHGARHLPRRVPSRGRHRAGCGARPARAAPCADHDRRHRRQDDGADRRDRRRRGAQLLRAARVQRQRPGAAGKGRAESRAARWTISTARS